MRLYLPRPAITVVVFRARLTNMAARTSVSLSDSVTESSSSLVVSTFVRLFGGGGLDALLGDLRLKDDAGPGGWGCDGISMSLSGSADNEGYLSKSIKENKIWRDIYL